MPKKTQTMLADLKRQLGDYELTDDDFYPSEEVAEVGPDIMFRYFREELDDDELARVVRFASESKLFLSNLIGIGEIALADQLEASEPAAPMSWLDIGSLATSTADARAATLATSNGLRLDLASTQMMAADSGTLDVDTKLPFGATANVYEDGDSLVIKITSEDQSLDGKLVGFCLSDAQEDKLGFVLLRAGLADVVSGKQQLDRSSVSGEYVLNFNLVDSSDLFNADFELLESSLAADLQDKRSVAAWRQWIDQTASSEDGPGLTDGLARLTQRLS